MLYIVSTPIGNLADISYRAAEILEKVDVVLAEDSRVTRKLLDFLKLKNKKIIPFYDEVEERKNFEVIKMLENDMEVALVSDAGTPLLSDPGYGLVKLCHKKNIKYTAIPGPSAVTNALILSGLPADKFVFIGFLPKKKSKRLEKLSSIKEFKGSKVIFESGKRLNMLLDDLESVYGDDIKVSICKEMTKRYEEVISGSINEVRNKLKDADSRGEATVVFI